MTTNASIPGFASDIKPLFREEDKDAMAYIFDLWNYDDVRDHAPDILARLEDGSMPCDDAWPETQVELFRQWIDAGTPA